MTETDTDDTATATNDPSSSSTRTDSHQARLRVEVYEALAARRGYRTHTAQALWHGMSRAALYDIKQGKTSPSISTAMHMARQCEINVDALFELVAQPATEAA